MNYFTIMQRCSQEIASKTGNLTLHIFNEILTNYTVQGNVYQEVSIRDSLFSKNVKKLIMENDSKMIKLYLLLLH